METMEKLKRFRATSLQAKLLVEFDQQPLTDFEAARRVMPTSFSVDGCRRRCTDLRACGYIRDSGKRRGKAVVWEITDAGDLALRSLLATGWDRPVFTHFS